MHEQDEFVLVLEGDVTVDPADAGEQRLAARDAVYYSGGVSHRRWAPLGQPDPLLVVTQSLVASTLCQTP